jgi:hypothetical protein
MGGAADTLLERGRLKAAGLPLPPLSVDWRKLRFFKQLADEAANAGTPDDTV